MIIEGQVAEAEAVAVAVAVAARAAVSTVQNGQQHSHHHHHHHHVHVHVHDHHLNHSFVLTCHKVLRRDLSLLQCKDVLSSICSETLVTRLMSSHVNVKGCRVGTVFKKIAPSVCLSMTVRHYHSGTLGGLIPLIQTL